MSEPTDEQPVVDPPVGTPDSDTAAPPGVAESVDDIEVVPLDDPHPDDDNGLDSES